MQLTLLVEETVFLAQLLPRRTEEENKHEEIKNTAIPKCNGFIKPMGFGFFFFGFYPHKQHIKSCMKLKKC